MRDPGSMSILWPPLGAGDESHCQTPVGCPFQFDLCKSLSPHALAPAHRPRVSCQHTHAHATHGQRRRRLRAVAFARPLPLVGWPVLVDTATRPLHGAPVCGAPAGAYLCLFCSSLGLASTSPLPAAHVVRSPHFLLVPAPVARFPPATHALPFPPTSLHPPVSPPTFTMVYLRNGQVTEGAVPRGPWPLSLIPGMGLLFGLWDGLKLFMRSLFSPSLQLDRPDRRPVPRRGWEGAPGGGGGGGGGSPAE